LSGRVVSINNLLQEVAKKVNLLGEINYTIGGSKNNKKLKLRF
jgi:hypothetical protein